MAVQKTYQYKVSTPSGTYLGLLQNVSSVFNFNQLLNTAFAQTTITVGQTADTSATTSSFAVTDELGAPILDESGGAVMDEGLNSVVGDNTLINENNLIRVYEYSQYNINGKLVFDGYISKWKIRFGSSNDIEITCLSNGTDMSNIIVNSGDTAFISQTTDDNSTINFGLQSAKSADFLAAAQTFTVGSAITLGAVSIELTTPEAGTLQVQIYKMVGASPSPSSDILLATGSISLGVLSTKSVQKVSMNSFPSLVTLTTYYWQASWNNSSGSTAQAQLYFNSTNPYANGQLYENEFNGASWNSPASFPTYDAYFVVWQHGTNVVGSYVSKDPSFMLTDIMSTYTSQGGLIGVPAAGIPSTGSSATYTFKLQTIVQAIQAITALAPIDWYWYVDPASGTLQFAVESNAADFTLIRKRHINVLELEATKETIKNVAYFSGGDDGTATSTNILVKVTNTQGSDRIGLAMLADNRVNSTTGGTVTARLIAQNNLNNNSSRTYYTSVTIIDGTMDISSIKLGMMAGFSGFGSFVDGLLLQVVGINYQPDQVTLQLGSLPKRDSQVVAQIQSQLQNQQTVANPSIPS